MLTDMESAPSYEEACKDGENHIQHVTLALVVPPPSPADTQPGTPTHKGEEKSILNESPPPYKEFQDEGEHLVSPSSQEEWASRSLEQKLIEAGLLTEGDLKNETVLGGDMTFVFSFFFTLMFNWIGMVFGFCLSNNMAAQYGALSGFGASMIKWTVIALNSACCSAYLKETTCLLITLIMSGFLLFCRGIYMYVRIKRQVQRGNPIQYLYLRNI